MCGLILKLKDARDYNSDEDSIYLRVDSNQIIEFDDLSFVDVKRVSDYQQLLLSTNDELFVRNLYGSNEMVKIIDKVEYICRCWVGFLLYTNNEWKWLLEDDVTRVSDVTCTLPVGRPINNYDNLLVIDDGESDIYCIVTIIHRRYEINVEEVDIPDDVIIIFQYNNISRGHIDKQHIIYMTSDGRIYRNGYELKNEYDDTPWVELHQQSPWIGSITFDGLGLLYNSRGDIYRFYTRTISMITSEYFFSIDLFAKGIFDQC